jgi:hypothetical protein
MTTISTGLEGLIDLDRQGVDIRPTLLRVLTDQYLQSAGHTPEEERQYTELALRLIDETDIATRAAVAARLATDPAAPRVILLQLARDVLAVAEPILRHSPCLTPQDCDAIVRERGPSYAEFMARRGEPVAEEPALPARAAEGQSAAHALARVEAQELSELFYAAGSVERRLILLNLEYVTAPPPKLPSPLQRADIWRLESAALQHNSGATARELEAALGISSRQARRMIEDELGEPIVVAAKAMNLPADVLQRIILFMNPRVGQSVDRVYELAALYNEISAEAANRMVAILRAADPAAGGKPQHERLTWRAAAESARRALSEISRAPTSARDASTRDTLDLQRASGTDRINRR